MRKTLKNLISGITAMSLLSAAYLPARADPESSTGSTKLGTLSVEFMGRGETPEDTSPGKARLTESDKNKIFWIGVAADKINDDVLFLQGIYSMEIAFEYNPYFVEPYTSTATPDSEWEQLVSDGNIKTGAYTDFDTYHEFDAAWWSEDYTVTAVRESVNEIDTTSDREDLAEAATRKTDGWKTCFVNIWHNSGNYSETNPYTGQYISSKVRFSSSHEIMGQKTKWYLIKLPFKLKNVPSSGDADTNPKPIRMVLGNDAFDIGFNERGTTFHAEWYASGIPDTDENLKTRFDFAGDVSLFDAGGSITNITATDVTPTATPNPDATASPEVTPDPEATPAPAATPMPLSRTTDLQSEGFSSEIDPHYLSVPYDTSTIRLNITSAELPKVTFKGTETSATLDTGQTYLSVPLELDPLDPETVDTDGGFKNTVTVTAGGETFTINIRRLLKPKIELNYGNSPHGEIMRADNIAAEDKQAAKDAFDDENMYSSDYLPTGKSPDVYYSLSAWGGSDDPKVNMDRDETALFAFEYAGFVDPGFEITDSVGKTVSLADVTRSIEVCVLPDKDMRETITPDMFQTYTTDGQTSNDIFTNEQLTGDEGRTIQPDIYKLTYSYYDDPSDKTESFTRNVVIIPKMGDTNLDDEVSVGDLIPIKNVSANNFTSVDSTVKAETYNLFMYRVMDTTFDEEVSVGDLIPIKNSSANIAIKVYYEPFTK